MKPTPEATLKLQEHYDRQAQAIAKVERWLKKTKPESLVIALDENCRRSSPFPMWAVRSIYLKNKKE